MLEELALEHELPRKVLEYRSIFKLKSTYADALIGLVNPKTGASIRPTTRRWQLPADCPLRILNLQNIPIRTEEGRKDSPRFCS